MTDASQITLPAGVTLHSLPAGHETILTHDALAFVASLHRQFAPRVKELLAKRVERQARLDKGERLNFLPETKEIRESAWTVAPLPEDLLDRRVEITGPIDRKMIINALNSGANVFMADCEDASSPTWANMVSGQQNLADAVRRTITYTAPETGKSYALNDKIATLLVRPRGWHMSERHMLVDGEPTVAGLFDFGMFFFHNAKEQIARGTGPYFYLPKMESHLEARLWNDVFTLAQKTLGVKHGTIKATVLIETLPGAFEMDEILYELRDHSAGLNCGRWDYIFSFIKKHRAHAAALLPDRGQVTMDKAFLQAYSLLLIKTCHKRHVHAMGGMAAFIPIKDNAEANEAALSKVKADKLREVKNGHDGTWVAHPGLVNVAKAIFDEYMPGKNQLDNLRNDIEIGQDDLLAIPQGTRSEDGMRHNIRVGVQYIEAWLRGQGCVPLYNLMEDAATAEISRAQVWQLLQHKATLEDGSQVTEERVKSCLEQEMLRIKQEVGTERFESGRFVDASKLFLQLVLAPNFEEFLTLPAYNMLALTDKQ